MSKSVGQTMAEAKAGKELPFNVLFFGHGFLRLPRDFVCYHETRDAAETEAHRILDLLGTARTLHPATIYAGYERIGSIV